MRIISEELYSDLVANLKYSVAQKHMDEPDRPLFRENCSNLIDRMHQIVYHSEGFSPAPVETPPPVIVEEAPAIVEEASVVATATSPNDEPLPVEPESPITLPE